MSDRVVWVDIEYYIDYNTQSCVRNTNRIVPYGHDFTIGSLRTKQEKDGSSPTLSRVKVAKTQIDLTPNACVGSLLSC